MKVDLQFYLRTLWKDTRYSLFPALRGLLIPSLIGFLIFLSIANSYAFTEDKPTDRYPAEDYELQYDHQYQPSLAGNSEYSGGGGGGTVETGSDEQNIERIAEVGASIYAIGASQILLMPMGLILFIVHALVYSKEIGTGTIRSYFHYPISYRKMVYSKAMNVIIQFTAIILFLTFLTSAVLLAWSISLAMPLLMIGMSYIFIVGLYLFFVTLTIILQRLSVKKFTDPILLMLVGTTFLLLITETSIYTINLIFAEIFRYSTDPPFLTILRYLTPFHTYGRLTDLIIVGEPVEVLDFLWIPIFLLFVINVPFIMKRVYPDIFIKETA